jgi:membrane-associated protein
MPDLTELFLNGVNNYGVLILAVAMFIASGGLPSPAFPLVIAAGALARQDIIDPFSALIVIFASIVAGDIFSYGLGRFGGDWVARHLTPRREAFLKRADDMFSRYGPVSLYLTHSFFTSLDVPANVTAGLSRYSFRHFIVYVLTGRATWVLLYGTTGYLLGSQWQLASQFVSRYIGWLGLALIVFLAGYYLIRRRGGLRALLGKRPASEAKYQKPG